MEVEIAALTKETFRSWPLEKREAYLKEHPNSKYHYHELLEKKGIELPATTPKLGTNWAAHARHPDPDHHRRHAKAHAIAAHHIEEKIKKLRPRTKLGVAEKHELMEQASLRKKWQQRHQKLYKKLADELLK